MLPHLQQQNHVCSGLKLTAPSEDQLKLLGHPAANFGLEKSQVLAARLARLCAGAMKPGTCLSDAGALFLGLSCEYLFKLGMLPEVLQLLHGQHGAVLSIETQ